MRLKGGIRGNESHSRQSFCPQPEYVKFSWAAISLVASPLEEPAKKKGGEQSSKLRDEGKTGKEMERQSECCRGENKSEEETGCASRSS